MPILTQYCNTLKNSPGYGLALIVVFVVSTILIGTSFQLLSAPTVMTYLGSSSQDNLTARQLAITAMDTVEADILSKLNAGDTIDAATYRYPASGTVNITAPQDPNNLGGASTVVGSYYATLTAARDRAYVITVYVTVGGATTSYSKLILADNASIVATPTDPCAAVQDEILAGNIASISNADLIAWAQSGCLVKTASVTPVTPTAGSGSASSCTTHSGTGGGTLSFSTLGSCTTSVTGTYPTIQLASAPASSNNSAELFSYPNAGVTSRTIQIPGNVADNTTIKAQNSGGTISTVPHTFIFGSGANPPGRPEVLGGNGDDTVYFNTASTVQVFTREGNNSIIANATWGNATAGSYIRLGESGSTGNNSVYINYIQAYNSSVNATIDTFSSGPSHIYFNNIGAGGPVTINGGTGNDIIGCGVTFSGSTPSCGVLAPVTTVFSTGNNNDIISIDQSIPATYVLNPGTGHNIVYTKGCASGATIMPGSSTSLVASGGNRACNIWGSGGTSVFMKKSGTTDSGTVSGFARTLTY